MPVELSCESKETRTNRYLENLKMNSITDTEGEYWEKGEGNRREFWERVEQWKKSVKSRERVNRGRIKSMPGVPFAV